MKNFAKFHHIAVLAAMMTISASAQAQITGRETDDKFANTTVVYKENGANDQIILSQLEASLGMGDVVRITVAPPKPQKQQMVDAEPAKPVRVVPPAPQRLAAPAPKSPETPAKPVAQVAEKPQTAVPAVKTAEKPQVKVQAVKTVEKPVVQAAAPAAPSVKSAGAAKSGKSGKTVKKSSRKSGSAKLFRKKYKARGKQRTGCYKF